MLLADDFATKAGRRGFIPLAKSKLGLGAQAQSEAFANSRATFAGAGPAPAPATAAAASGAKREQGGIRELYPRMLLGVAVPQFPGTLCRRWHRSTN